jgi:hypothetical protein
VRASLVHPQFIVILWPQPKDLAPPADTLPDDGDPSVVRMTTELRDDCIASG